MSMFWNARWAAGTDARGGVAFVQVLTAASIAAVVSSCSTIKAQSEPDVGDVVSSSEVAEEFPPPPKVPLTDDLRAALDKELKKFLPDVEREIYSVDVAYIEPTDQNEPEKLIAIGPNGSEGIDPEFPADRFLIPPRAGDTHPNMNFAKATVKYVFPGSSIRRTRCGAVSSGGTRYCEFD